VFQHRTKSEPLQPKNIVKPRVREARRRRNPRVTQAELSALLAAYGVRIDRAGISKIEAGDRIVLDFEVKALGGALAVSVSWLLDEEELP